MNNFQEKVSFIWSIAEILRGPYRPEDYGDVILPMAVLRRFDAVLEDTKEEVLKQYEQYKHLPESTRDEVLNRVAKQKFYNTRDRKSTRLNSSHVAISYAVFCLKKKKTKNKLTKHR